MKETRIVAGCPWLDWSVDVYCAYSPVVPFLRYFLQMFPIQDTDECHTLRKHTVLEIEPHADRVTVRCADQVEQSESDCHAVFGSVAKLCNYDFLTTANERWCLLHGAAVSSDGRGAHLFLADSGVGKSTLCYALCADGFQFCTDDLIILDTDRGKLLPYPKPLYLRDTSFLSHPKGPENAPWNRFFMRFAGNERKYPIIPPRHVQEPIVPAAVHLYERGDRARKTALSPTDGYRALLFSAMRVVNMRRYSEQLLDIIRTVPIDRIECADFTDPARVIKGEPEPRAKQRTAADQS